MAACAPATSSRCATQRNARWPWCRSAPNLDRRRRSCQETTRARPSHSHDANHRNLRHVSRWLEGLDCHPCSARLLTDRAAASTHDGPRLMSAQCKQMRRKWHAAFRNVKSCSCSLRFLRSVPVQSTALKFGFRSAEASVPMKTSDANNPFTRTGSRAVSCHQPLLCAQRWKCLYSCVTG